MTTVSIPLHSRKYPGLVALIDEVDVPRVAGYQWFPDRRGQRWYARAYIRGAGRHGVQRHVYLHRLLVDASPGTEVDHRDLDGLNCTRGNLRIASHGQNSHNKAVRRDSSVGFKGVTWHKQHRRWWARIGLNGDHRSLGLYNTADEAARAYDAKARELHGEFARLNFPD